MGVVLAPVNGKGSALRLARAGARELYVGFYDPAWTEKFGENAALNRMSGFGQEANTLTFAELVAEIGEARRGFEADGIDNVSLFCVFNAQRYSAEQTAFIAATYLPTLAQIGFAGIIVSGPELIDAAHSLGLGAVASTMCAIYNEDLARYYHARGINRAILPRDVTLDDIASITAAVPELRYEVFFMRNGCVFADSHCMGLHKAGCPSTCLALRYAPSYKQLATFAGPKALDPWAWADNDARYRNEFHYSACGLCALWRFEQMGIDAYKIVGRGDDIGELASDIALAAENLAIARECVTETEYLDRMVRPDTIRELCAMGGMSCYYPEPRFGA